jgi:uncharacterized lipoprotein YajG
MIISKYTLFIALIILLFTACNNTIENTPKEGVSTDNTTETTKVFIENEERILEEKEVPVSEDDSVQVQDPKTGEWVKMTMKEAQALVENKK